MTDVALTGLDGAQLLGFLAGLGVLDMLTETMTPGSAAPRLAWRYSGTWYPVVSGAQSDDEVAERMLADSCSQRVQDVLGFRYVKVEKRGAKEVRALTPPVAVLRAWFMNELERDMPAAASYASCLMCETATEGVDPDKVPGSADLSAAGIAFDPEYQLEEMALPTPFDFTSRNTQFLDQIRRVGDALTVELALQELREGVGAPCERIMRWDTLTDLPGAMFGSVRPTPRPVAEWLAFRGLALLPLSGAAGRVAMAGFEGRRKAGHFSWVLWDGLLSRDAVRTVLGHPSLIEDGSERAARGCVAGFSVVLGKDATGYDGSVSPSSPLAVR